LNTELSLIINQLPTSEIFQLKKIYITDVYLVNIITKKINFIKIYNKFNFSNSSMGRTEERLMSNNSKIVLGLAVVVVLALFVMLFMGLGDKPVTVPRAPL